MNYSQLPSYKQEFIRTHTSQGSRAEPKISTLPSVRPTTAPTKPALGLLTKTTATNDIWNSTGYSNPDWRSYLNKSFYRADYSDRQQQLSQELNRENGKFNRKRSRISEYSNALYNSKVFLNTRYTSC